MSEELNPTAPVAPPPSTTPSDIVDRLRKPNGVTDFAAMIEAANLIVRMREALKECSATWDSGPTTLVQVLPLISKEFQRRIDIAGKALLP